MMPQQISKKIFIYLFFFITLVTVNNSKISNNFYNIKQIYIVGLNKEETKKIYDSLIVFKKNNIFLFDKKDISEKIYSNKFVEKFEIFKIYPSTLNIKVKKTKFLGITKKNSIDYLIGTNGKLIERKNENLNLPYIFGNINVKDFLKFKKIIDESNFKFYDFENLYYFKSDRWDVKTKRGLSIKLPSELTVEKLNLIYKIIKKKNFSVNKTFDFRQKNMMVINEQHTGS